MIRFRLNNPPLVWRSIALPTTILLLAGGAPLAGDSPPWPERWLYNPTERTDRALERFESGDVESAADLFESALRLAGDRPVAQYNASTARLSTATGDPRPLLEAAAQEGSSEFLAHVQYNLGNARMAAGDLRGAIEAFANALRHNPDLEDSKFNLELAQRQLQEQQEQQNQEQKQQEQKQQEQKQQNPGEGEQQEQQRQEDRKQQDQHGGQKDSQQQKQEQQRPQESPLPQFRDLPDMTAAEAAAILEAIENMEREGRRREALDAARQQRRGKKDW